MELTQEYFEKHLSEQLGEIHNRLDNITTTMATKDDLKELRTEMTSEMANMASKEDLKTQTKELQDYTDGVGATIIEAIGSSIIKLDKRLTVLETSK